MPSTRPSRHPLQRTVGALSRARQVTHRWSLRARIIAVLAVLMAGAMFIVGTAGSWQLHSYLLQREDADLRAAAPTLVSATIKQEEAQKRAKIPLARQTAQVPAVIPTNVYAVRLVNAERTRDIAPASAPRPDFGTVSVASATARAGHPYTVGSYGAPTAQWRVVQGIDTQTRQPYAVAVSLGNAHRVVRQMQVLTIFVSTLALLLAVGAGLFAVRRALRPLRDIEDTASDIAAGDLSRRVPNPGSADEVERLSESLNVMLTQIERSMEIKDRSEESMRRFVADASHELRTPLATVRGYAELYRQGAMTDPEAITAGFGRIENEARRMSDMVEDLLLLSRLETEQRAATTGESGRRAMRDVDLTVLCADTVADAEARRSGDRRFHVRGLDGPLEPVVVSGDEQRLRQVVTNLVSNTERYTPPGTPVEVCVGVQAAEAVVKVVDHGPGIPEDMRSRIFERFFRADVARNRATGSTGLGLSIVAAIVAAHGGTIGVDETPGGGATFTVRIPLSTKASGSHRAKDSDQRGEVR